MLLHCVLTAENAPAPFLDVQMLQYQSMLQATENEPVTNPRFPMYFLDGDADRADVCAWSGIFCADGTVQTIVWSGTEVIEAIRIEWIPHSAQKLHFSFIFVGKAREARSLPREIRYLFLDRCNTLRGALRHVELRGLPSKMEEVHIKGCGLTGTVFLTELPESMRSISIRDIGLEAVYVANNSLPEGLKAIHVAGTYGEDILKCVDAPKADSRVKSVAWLAESKYVTETEEMLETFRERMQAVYFEERWGRQ